MLIGNVLQLIAEERKKQERNKFSRNSRERRACTAVTAIGRRPAQPYDSLNETITPPGVSVTNDECHRVGSGWSSGGL